jgi:hypothetical protein
VSKQEVDRELIERVLLAAAPERKAELLEIWRRQSVQFFVVPPNKGVVIRAGSGGVLFDSRALSILWMLGFAAWRAFRCYSPHVLLLWATGTPIDDNGLRRDAEFAEAQAAFEGILYATRGAQEGADPEAIWPAEVPNPRAVLAPDGAALNTEDKAAFDLTMIGGAFVFLHEIRHVIYARGGARPSPRDEELQCDAFAHEFLLGGVDDYGAKTGEDPARVLTKRAMGIALGAFFVYEITPREGLSGNDAYPHFADRVEELILRVPVPADSDFWIFACTLLLAVVRRRHRAVELTDTQPKNACASLIRILRELA